MLSVRIAHYASLCRPTQSLFPRPMSSPPRPQVSPPVLPFVPIKGLKFLYQTNVHTNVNKFML